MIHIEFKVFGKPIPKGRPRVTKTGRAYTPKRTLTHEALVRAAAEDALEKAGLPTFAGPVGINLLILHQRPKTRPKAIPLDTWKEKRVMFKPTRPDIDNTIKTVLDGLDTVLLDDAQVVALSVTDNYAPPGMEAQTIVHIREVAL